MTEKVRMPADLDQVTLKLLGKLKTSDLARIGLPTTASFSYVYQASSPSPLAFASLGIAAGLGGAWALWKPWGRTIDQNLYQGLRWTWKKNSTDPPELDGGEVRNDDGAVAALIEVDPVNLELKSGGEKAAFHRLYQELLQSIDYPVTVYSTQDRFKFTSYFDDVEDEDPVQENYQEYCEDLVEDGKSRTRHYIEVRVSTGDRGELSNRVGEILEQLSSGGLTTYRVTEIDSGIESSPELGLSHISHPSHEDKEYSKTLYVSEFPQEVDFSWVSQVLQVDGLVDVTQSVLPKSSADTVSKLQKLENKAEAENESLVRKGYGSSRKLERLLNDVDWFQNLLADQKDQPVRYGVYITAYGSNKEECTSTLRKVENRLKTLGITYQGTALRTDQAYQASTPGLPDKLGEQLLVPSGSAASGFPFTSPSNIDENGVLYGTSESTASPIILDRFKWNAGHQVMAGVTGSGKSFHSKLLLLRSAQIYDNLQINIVDPKPEYGDLAETLREYSEVNRFETEASIQDDTEKLIEAVEEAYQSAQEAAGKTIVVIDEAHRLLKMEQGASVLSTLVREARSSNTAVTLITQTISDFTRTEDGADILKNIPCKILFAHENADNEPGEAFNLSNNTKTRLYNLAKGDEDATDYSQAILSVSNQLETQIKIEASHIEASLIENGEIPEIRSNSSGSFETDHSQETVYNSTEESSRIKSITESITAVLSDVERPSLPDISISSGKESSDKSHLSSGEKEEREWSLPNPGLDQVSAVLKKTFQATIVLVLLLLGVTAVEGLTHLFLERIQVESLLIGPLLFTAIIGALLIAITVNDIYNSREEALSDYTLKRIIGGTVLHLFVLWVLATFLIGLPLTIVNKVAQAITDPQLRTSVYVAAALLELGVMAKLGKRRRTQNEPEKPDLHRPHHAK